MFNTFIPGMPISAGPYPGIAKKSTQNMSVFVLNCYAADALLWNCWFFVYAFLAQYCYF